MPTAQRGLGGYLEERAGRLPGEKGWAATWRRGLGGYLEGRERDGYSGKRERRSVNSGDLVLLSPVPQQVDQGLAIRDGPAKSAPQIVNDPLIVIQHCG